MLSCQLPLLPACKRANAPAAPSVLLLHSRPGTAAVVLVAGWDDLGLVGLRNETGEYNCFLNTIIQCLWRCADFRQQVGVYLLEGIWPQWPAACLLASWLMHGPGQLAALSSPRRLLLCLLIAGLQVAGWDAGFCAADPIVGARCTPCSSSLSSRSSSGTTPAAGKAWRLSTQGRCGRLSRRCRGSSLVWVSQPCTWMGGRWEGICLCCNRSSFFAAPCLFRSALLILGPPALALALACLQVR